MNQSVEALPPHSAAAPALQSAQLLVERTVHPVGVDVAPRISWTLAATGPDIELLSAEVRVSEGGRPVWRGSPAELPNEVECPLDVLASDSRYEAEVRCATSAGSVAGRTSFRTGLLAPSDWAGSHWISAPAGLAGAAPLFRAEFGLSPGVSGARLVLAAGGVARVLLNGRQATGEVLPVGITGFDRRVQYAVWEVGEHLVTGTNVLTVELGRGFYAMAEPNTWSWEKSPWRAEPCLRFQLRADLPDGTRVVAASAPGLPVIAGPTTYDDLYGGESHDARLRPAGAELPGFDDSGWRAAVAVPGPTGELVRRRQPPIRIIETLPLAVAGRDGDRWLLDAGRVVAGWARVSVRGPRGHRLRLRFGEQLTADGRPDNRDLKGHYNGRFQLDEFVLAGTGGAEQWEPAFTWHGFRYVEVEGWPEPELEPGAVVAQVVHNDVAVTGGFRTTDATLQGIHDITVPTVLNNLYSIPTDTPMYEKNGWTADGMLGTPLMLLNLDSHELLAKWVDDIADARDPAGIPRVLAPHGAWGFDWSPAPTWHAAYVLVPWWLYLHSGDRRVLERHSEGILGYLAAELARCPGGIAQTTLADWVSPEASPEGGNPPEDTRVSATAFLARMLAVGAAICEVLGRAADAARLRHQAALVRSAFRASFLDRRAGMVRGAGETEFRQAHNVLALAFGLVPQTLVQTVADQLAADVLARRTHLNTGALATRHLLPVLTRHGHADLALALARQRTYPSWGYWLEHGATTLWEHWHEDSRSRDHYFLGTVDEWFFGSVAGLARGGVGWSTVRFQPRLLGLLPAASAWVTTRHGRAAISWEAADGRAEVEVTVPVGARGEVRLPGIPQAPPGVAPAAAGPAIIMTGSGRHRFTVVLPGAVGEGSA